MIVAGFLSMIISGVLIFHLMEKAVENNVVLGFEFVVIMFGLPFTLWFVLWIIIEIIETFISVVFIGRQDFRKEEK